MRVLVEVGAAGGGLVPLLEAAVTRTLLEAGARHAEVSLTLLDDDGMRALNERYLGHDRPTDVLAFSLGEEDVLGDVYVGSEQARRQAEEHGVGVDEELVRLAIHGTLHVLGHEHPDDDRERSAMFVLQERLVREVMEGR